MYSRKEMMERKILSTHNMINDFEKKMNKEKNDTNCSFKNESSDKLLESFVIENTSIPADSNTPSNRPIANATKKRYNANTDQNQCCQQ